MVAGADDEAVQGYPELTPFATLEDLESRLDYRLSDLEKTVARSALEDASTLARHYGTNWGSGHLSTPPLVKVIVLNACRRYMKLIEGVTMSRAGDETLQWTDLKDRTGTVFFTGAEQEQLRALAGKNRQLVTIGMYAHIPPALPHPNSIPQGYVKWPTTREPFMVESSTELEKSVGVARE